MALGARLDLRQAQSLVMTPQLQQAIKLLQLSSVDLLAYVDQELERNPLLERAEGADEGPAEPSAPEAPADAGDRLLDSIAGADEVPLDIDYDNTFTSDGPADGGGDESGHSLADWGGRGGRTDFADDDGDMDRALAGKPSLRDHLSGQINLELADSGDRLIGLYLIELLDDAGYLTGDLAEAAQALGCGPARVEAVLARLQGLDPAGIFARDLKECLALQLKERNRLDPAMQALLDNLVLLARRDFAGLSAVCGVDADDVRDMVAEVRALDPKPAFSFDDTVASPVVPDVLMRAGTDGGWIVELNADTLPRLLVDARYYAKVSRSAKSKDDRAYLAENFQAANWLVKSLHQRATTILRVATELVRQQDEFFRKGIEHLRPLILRDIAQAIEMHESTVSRVTSNKYIASPRGIFELKYFFTQAIASNTGESAHSAEAVRHRIKIMIDAEEPTAILSDDMIVDILRKDGVEIARRTVAKYRDGLRIPSSVQRRREKSLGSQGRAPA